MPHFHNRHIKYRNRVNSSHHSKQTTDTNILNCPYCNVYYFNLNFKSIINTTNK